MSNTQQAALPKPVRGDFGIGLCVACLNEHVSGERKIMPEFALALVPVPGFPAPLGCCYDHLAQLIAGANKPKLWSG